MSATMQRQYSPLPRLLDYWQSHSIDPPPPAKEEPTRANSTRAERTKSHSGKCESCDTSPAGATAVQPNIKRFVFSLAESPSGTRHPVCICFNLASVPAVIIRTLKLYYIICDAGSNHTILIGVRIDVICAFDFAPNHVIVRDAILNSFLRKLVQ